MKYLNCPMSPLPWNHYISCATREMSILIKHNLSCGAEQSVGTQAFHKHLYGQFLGRILWELQGEGVAKTCKKQIHALEQEMTGENALSVPCEIKSGSMSTNACIP